MCSIDTSHTASGRVSALDESIGERRDPEDDQELNTGQYDNAGGVPASHGQPLGYEVVGVHDEQWVVDKVDAVAVAAPSPLRRAGSAQVTPAGEVERRPGRGACARRG